MEANSSATSQAPDPSPWGAFGHLPFTVIWIASTIGLIGIAMYDTASGWLMTTLNADPLAVSSVQIATSLPMFLFTLPAGALADVIDARRFLIVVSSAIAALMATFGALVFLDLATPFSLLATTFVLSSAWALNAPAWLSITPALVPRSDLDAAIAAGGVGYNISRVVGPALGGLAIVELGMAAPFWAFAASNLAAIAALVWWRSPRRSAESLPAERLTSAVRTGFRHAANNQPLRATMVRTVAIYPFASAYLALLPLIARSQIGQGPEFYGVLLGAISAGAIAGSFAINRLKDKLGPDRVVALGSIATAIALVLFGLARGPLLALGASFLAGGSWIVVLASLYVSAQEALPDWVRGRGLSIFLTVIFGAMTVGSAVWGKVAAMAGLPTAQFVAAAGAILAIPLTWSWKLQTAAQLDLSPSLHWQVPPFTLKVENDQGPVLVSVEYRVDSKNRSEFLAALEEMGHERKRDGAFAWGVFEDAVLEGRYVETFLIESWLELRHLRQRVTNADRMIEDRSLGLLNDAPQSAILVAPERRGGSRKWRFAGAGG
jgi:predicted MFS family arabinose efflux permease